jgi:F0F1-type ATP synthase membrane subunit a
MKEKINKEKKMRFMEKALILLVAVVISLVAFSLISAPAVDMVKVGKQAGYEIITNWIAKADVASDHTRTRKA